MNTTAPKHVQIQFRHSLQARLLVAFVLITFLPLVGLQVLSTVQAYNNLSAEIRRSFSNMAADETAYLTLWSAERVQDIRTLSAMKTLQTFDKDSAQQSLDQYKAAWGIYDAIALGVPPGRSEINTDHKTIDVSQRSYFLDALAGKESISAPTISKGTGKVIIIFAAPLVSDGKNVGSIAGMVRLDDIGRILNQVDLGKTGEAYLVDKNGVMVTPPKYEDYLKATGAITDTAVLKYTVNTFASQQITAGKSGVSQYTNYRGKPVVGAYTWLPALQLGLILEEEQAELLAPVSQNLTLSIVLIIVILVILGVIVVLAAQTLTRPITQLTAVAARISEGDLTARAHLETADEIGLLATTLNNMTAQHRQTLEGLELRVVERTRALETSAQIGRRLSTLLDEDQIVAEVAAQLRAAYDYYHVHIYLYDAAREVLVLAGGTGEVGRALRAQGHRLARGQGLVGRAAETNTVVLASDVTQMPGWLPNPLLPDTRSEVAVPMALGGQVLGVLDVQQNIVGALKPYDADLIQAVAQQAAIALQNARSFAQAQREAHSEALIRHITQEIQSTTTAPAALQVAVRELGKALGAERVRVRLGAAGPGPDTRSAGGETKE